MRQVDNDQSDILRLSMMSGLDGMEGQDDSGQLLEVEANPPMFGSEAERLKKTEQRMRKEAQIRAKSRGRDRLISVDEEDCDSDSSDFDIFNPKMTMQ